MQTQQQMAVGLASRGSNPTDARGRTLRLRRPVISKQRARTGGDVMVAGFFLVAIALFRPALAVLPEQDPEQQAGHPHGLIAVLGEDRARCWGHTMNLYLTPDEQRVYLTESQGFVSAFDTKTLKRVLQFRPHKKRCLDIALMDAGRKLISVSLDGTVALWDLTANPPKQLQRTTIMPKDNQRIWMNLSASSGSNRFAVQCMDFNKENQGRFIVFDVRGDSLVELADLSDSTGRRDHSRFAISPDGRWLASCEFTEGSELVQSGRGMYGHRNAEVIIRDLNAARAAVASRTPGKHLERLQFSPDGQLWATDPYFLPKRSDYRWELNKGKLGDRKVLAGSNVFSRRAFTDVANARVAQDQASIRITGTGDSQHIATVNASSGRFTGATALLKDGTLIVTSGPVLQRWEKDADSYKKQPLPTGHQSAVSGLMYDPKTNSLISSAGDALREWKLDEVSSGEPIPGTELPFTGGKMRLWPGRKGFLFVESSENQRTIRGVRRAGNKMLSRFGIPVVDPARMHVWCLAMHPTEPVLATGHQDAKIRTWDVSGSKPQQIAEWQGHQTHVCALEFSPDGRHLYSGGWDHKANRWTSEDSWRSAPEAKALMTTHADIVRSIACTSDGRFVASGGEGGQILLRDEQSPGAPMSLMHPGDPKPTKNSNDPRTPNSLQFSRDGKRLLSADTAGRVTVWNVPEGKINKTWQLAGMVWTARFVSDETMIATANDDGTVFLLETPPRD